MPMSWSLIMYLKGLSVIDLKEGPVLRNTRLELYAR